MKTVMLSLSVQLLSIAFAVGAIIMAVNGVEGWGWMVFAAVLTVGTVKIREKY